MNRKTNKTRALEVQTRRLTQTEFVEIATFADALQTIDQQRSDSSKLNAILSGYKSSSIVYDAIPVQALYDNAKNLAIDPNYIDLALARYPTLDEMREDMKSFKAVPTFSTISDTYSRELLSTLRTKFPLNTFESEVRNLHFPISFVINKVTETPAEKYFLWWKVKDIKIKKKDQWAEITHRSLDDNITITINEPLFLSACKSTLKSLEKRFDKFFNDPTCYVQDCII